MRHFQANGAAEGTSILWANYLVTEVERRRCGAEINTLLSPELMVDLRLLPTEIRDTINQVCTPDQYCSASVRGTRAHLRGTNVSELGIVAAAVSIEPAATLGRGNGLSKPER